MKPDRAYRLVAHWWVALCCVANVRRLLVFDVRLERFGLRGVVTALLLVVLVVLVGACSEDGSGVTLPDGSEVSAPEVTAPEAAPEPAPAPEPVPEEPAAEAEDDGSTAPLWVIVILGIIIIGFISYFAARSGSKKQSQPVAAAAPPAVVPVSAEWKGAARSAYAESRWLYDEMDVELATWRGDTLYEAQVANGAAALDTMRQATWNQLPARMGAARDGLYRLESMVGDPHVAQLATALVANLDATRAAVDRLADARRSRRAVEADPGSNPTAVTEARTSESRAADELTADRRRLGDATSNFSAAI
jgi:hypothetical protein